MAAPVLPCKVAKNCCFFTLGKRKERVKVRPAARGGRSPHSPGKKGDIKAFYAPALFSF